ncbi:hypothetical protein [Tolypothrix sp. VBCCA 56010]
MFVTIQFMRSLTTNHAIACNKVAMALRVTGHLTCYNCSAT